MQNGIAIIFDATVFKRYPCSEATLDTLADLLELLLVADHEFWQQ
jgi:hypothetical protein